MLADLFPDHYWAAGNAALVCGERLGDREDKFHYTLLVADMRSSWNWNCRAAAEVVFHEGDYERARHYIERAREFAANLTGARLGAALSCTELFAAEEYLGRGLLPQVLAELQRVEQTLVRGKTAQIEKVFHEYVEFKRLHEARTQADRLHTLATRVKQDDGLRSSSLTDSVCARRGVPSATGAVGSAGSSVWRIPAGQMTRTASAAVRRPRPSTTSAGAGGGVAA